MHNRRDREYLVKSVVGQDEHLPIQWQCNMAKFDHRHSPTLLGRPALLSKRRSAMPLYYHQIGLPSILCQRLNRQLYPVVSLNKQRNEITAIDLKTKCDANKYLMRINGVVHDGPRNASNV